jgi:hypothetical protein
VRTCKRCAYTGPEFYRGNGNVCKECVKAARKARYRAEPERAKAASRAWHHANRERANAERKERRADPSYRNPKQRREECPRCGSRDLYEGGGCRRCARAAQRERRMRDPDRVRSLERDWRRRNAERVAAQKARHYRRHRGEILQRRHRAKGEDAEYVAVLLGDPCSYCGDRSTGIDHIQATARGGTDAWENFTAACAWCNSVKGARPLLEAMLSGLYRRKAGTIF